MRVIQLGICNVKVWHSQVAFDLKSVRELEYTVQHSLHEPRPSTASVSNLQLVAITCPAACGRYMLCS